MATISKKNMFNEATRVQMPAMVHLTRLGYTYFGKITEDMAGTVYDPDTNILINVFKEQFARLNPTHVGEVEQTLKTIRQELDNDDIGYSFYKHLLSVSPIRLVDFENPKNNTYHFTAEFTCKRDQDEFRPDITLFVNGLPLVFVEVKKPNNYGGMVAESKRMNQKRFPNKKFRRFLNITQLMIFSNNMEYDTMGGIVPVQGAFYCTTAKQSAPFNCFREENPANLDIAPYNADFPYIDIDPLVEKRILTDFNCQVIHTSPEYQTNLDTYTPTNRVLTSMCSPERLLFILKYGIAYVRFHKEINGRIEFIEQKHIMRYQQMFAALTVRSKIDEGVNSGIIWHTQGSGKTALSYYLTYVLSDYFSKQNKVAKFYFIVDRLDLLKQASEEFEARGLVVKTASSRVELMEQFRNNQAQEGNTGKPEITVVNIQRFAEDGSTIMARLLVGNATDLHSIECYDPSAGTGTLLMALAHKIGEDKCTIFAQDISQRSNKMLKLNLILNSLVSSLDHAIQGDTLIAPYHKSDNGQELRTFDYVVSNPPFKMDFSDTRERIAAMPVRFWAGVPKVPAKKKESMAIYTLFIQHVLNSLKSTGKGAIVVPTGFVTAKSGVEKKILQHIVDEHIVYGCISMPSNVFANTGTNVSVLFFDNSRKTDKVVLIDASKLGEEYKDGNNQKRRLRDFEIDKIVDTFLNKEAVDDFSVAVTYDEIKEKKYSLAAGQYFDVKIEYVELSQDEFNARMSAYAEKLQEYFVEGDKLKTEIMEQLKKVKYE